MKVWSPIPPHITLIETLQKKGALSDDDLLKVMKKKFEDYSYRELNNLLIKLEVMGIIQVSRLMKGKKSVELIGKR